MSDKEKIEKLEQENAQLKSDNRLLQEAIDAQAIVLVLRSQRFGGVQSHEHDP